MARVVALLAAREDVLELVHARVGEEQRRVLGRDERGGRTRRCRAPRNSGGISPELQSTSYQPFMMAEIVVRPKTPGVRQFQTRRRRASRGAPACDFQSLANARARVLSSSPGSSSASAARDRFLRRIPGPGAPLEPRAAVSGLRVRTAERARAKIVEPASLSRPSDASRAASRPKPRSSSDRSSSSRPRARTPRSFSARSRAAPAESGSRGFRPRRNGDVGCFSAQRTRRGCRRTPRTSPSSSVTAANWPGPSICASISSRAISEVD